MHEKNHRCVETIMLIVGLRVMKDDKVVSNVFQGMPNFSYVSFFNANPVCFRHNSHAKLFCCHLSL